MKKTTIELFSTGYCTANNKHVHPKEKRKKVKFHAVCAIIDHPTLGRILFDTGYSKHFFEKTKNFPYIFYKWATPVFHQEKDSCIEQLKKRNIKINDIKHLIVSHFHADHIAGLKDFNGIRFWCSKTAYKHFKQRKGIRAVSKGYIPELIPYKSKPKYIEVFCEKFIFNGFTSYKWTEDLFFVELPGHARGQIGLYIKNTNLGDVFLIADASWSSKAIQENTAPSKIVKIFIDNYNELKDTLYKLHLLQKKEKELLIVPTHCQEMEQYFS